MKKVYFPGNFISFNILNTLNTLNILKVLIILILLPLLLISLNSCTFKEYPLGHNKNPIKFYFVPSLEINSLKLSYQVLKVYLEKKTPYKFQMVVPMNYISVVEAFGSRRADIAEIGTFGYILAHERFGAEAKLVIDRYGKSTYQGAIIVHQDSKIKNIKDLEDKKMAYVDPSSTSGYMLSSYLLKKNNVNLKEVVFAGTHDNVVSMVYRKQVDAGSIFYYEPVKKQIRDARRLVEKKYPDIIKKTRILILTPSIPNEPIVFRKDMPAQIKKEVIKYLIKFIDTPQGKKFFSEQYGISDFKAISDDDYASIKKIYKKLKKDLF